MNINEQTFRPTSYDDFTVYFITKIGRIFAKQLKVMLALK